MMFLANFGDELLKQTKHTHTYLNLFVDSGHVKE